MAEYRIVSVNKMSSGARRGVIDMTIALGYAVNDKVFLLDGISVDVNDPETEDTAIEIESAYKHSLSEYLGSYKSSNLSNALATEKSLSSIVLNET